MPKMKTHRGAAKRFKITGTGKILRRAGVPQPHAREEAVDAHAPPQAARPRSPAATRRASSACSAR